MHNIRKIEKNSKNCVKRTSEKVFKKIQINGVKKSYKKWRIFKENAA